MSVSHTPSTFLHFLFLFTYSNTYCLHLPPSMSRLHPVFNIVKLTPAPDDPIPGRRLQPPPLLEIVNRVEEWIVEEILDSRMINQKLWCLVKWEGFGVEHNSWEPWDNIHALDLVSEFHRRHPRAPWQVRFMDFNNIPFRTLPPVVPGCHSLEGGVDVRGHFHHPFSPMEYLCPATPNLSHLCTTPYIPPVPMTTP